VQFTSSQILRTPAVGQSRIESFPDGILNNLTTTIPGFFFDQAVFNLDATANGTANISAVDQFGTVFPFMTRLGRTSSRLRPRVANSSPALRSQLQLAWMTYRKFDLET
jgi:hypothetical protein